MSAARLAKITGKSNAPTITPMVSAKKAARIPGIIAQHEDVHLSQP